MTLSNFKSGALKVSSIVFFSSVLLPVIAVELKSGIDEQAKLPFWQVSDQGMSLRLVQRLPIQTRAFFLARGFNKEQTERIAQSCVFQTIFKNISHQTKSGVQASPLEYNLLDWVVIVTGEKRKMKTREDWAKEWKQEKIAKPVQLAFEWALYPTRQTYRPGDYNWGMSTFDLKPGTRFDLKVVWTQFASKHHTMIKNIQCAEDINPQPQGEQ